MKYHALLLRGAGFLTCVANASVSAAAEPDSPLLDVKANKVIVQFTDSGIKPSQLTLNKLDSSVFLVNRSNETPITVKLDFRGKKFHCHSKNLSVDAEGFLATKEPIAPFDFAVLCFPTAGTYPYVIREVSAKGKELRGEIVIDE